MIHHTLLLGILIKKGFVGSICGFNAVRRVSKVKVTQSLKIINHLIIEIKRLILCEFRYSEQDM